LDHALKGGRRRGRAYTCFRKSIFEQGIYLRLAKGVALIDKIPKEIIGYLEEYKAQYKILKVIE